MPYSSPKLTDYIPADALQRIMNTFSAVTGLSAVVRDMDEHVLAESNPSEQSARSLQAIQRSLMRRAGRQLPSVSIRVGEQRVGSLVLASAIELQAQALAEAHGDGARSGHVGEDMADEATRARHAAAIQVLYLLADTLAQACRQGLLLQERLEELTTLLQLSKLLTGQRGLEDVLGTITRSVVELMGVKAATIRLLNDDRKELVIQSAHGLSERYMNKGPILISESQIDQAALRGKTVYIEDMAEDTRVMYPDEGRREGLASILAVGMIYRGRPVGVMRVYTEKVQVFTKTKMYMLRAIAQMAAAATRNAQLDAERLEKLRIQRQVQLGAEVQRRLLPQSVPDCPPFELAGRYEPCFELGGDFYDFIPLGGTLGIAIGDVVGKGVAAGMLMASVRASLRAHAEDIYDLDDVMGRVNVALAHDTRDNEFATVFYGALDRQTIKLTYCSAGHEPVLLLRDNEFIELGEGGLPLGIMPGEKYVKGQIDLRPGDLLLAYTDGLTDAMNFDDERFGRDRLLGAMLDAAGGSAQAVVNHVLWEVRRFVGLKERVDDITLIAIRVDDSEA